MRAARLLPDGGISVFEMEMTGAPVPADVICPFNMGIDDEAFYTHDGTTITRRPQEEIDAIVAQREQARQDAKPQLLKDIENQYCQFLEVSWTGTLRQFGIIGPDVTITVQNTDSATNQSYLLAIMTRGDMSTFTVFSNLFLCFERAMGGNTADARRHT